MKLIVGLGNPGKEYEKTRHNIGFMVLDEVVSQLGGSFCDASKWPALTAEASVGGEKVIFMKPTTYMNRSGEAVSKFVGYYKLEPSDIWVVSDDLDLPLGRIRVRHEGTSGGHNGLKSIIEHFGTDAIPRIRLGIQRFTGDFDRSDPIPEEPEASIFVLQPFEKREAAVVENSVKRAAQIILNSLADNSLAAHTYEVGPTPTTI